MDQHKDKQIQRQKHRQMRIQSASKTQCILYFRRISRISNMSYTWHLVMTNTKNFFDIFQGFSEANDNVHHPIFPSVVEYVSQTRSDRTPMKNRVPFHMIQMRNLHSFLGLVFCLNVNQTFSKSEIPYCFDFNNKNLRWFIHSPHLPSNAWMMRIKFWSNEGQKVSECYKTRQW